MSFLPLYVPICLVIFFIVEMIKSDDVKSIVKRSLTNFSILTVILAAVSAVMFLMNKYL